jgi:hypothetical protein
LRFDDPSAQDSSLDDNCEGLCDEKFEEFNICSCEQDEHKHSNERECAIDGDHEVSLRRKPGSDVPFELIAEMCKPQCVQGTGRHQRDEHSE